MPPVVAHDALRLPGRTGGVENVEWIGREHRYARHCLSDRYCLVPVQILSGDQLGGCLRPLIDHNTARLEPGLRNRGVEQGFVSHQATRFDAARGS